MKTAINIFLAQKPAAEREKKEHSRTQPALNLITDVKRMVEDWQAQGMNRHPQVLTFAPTMHLVQRSYDELEQWAQEKGLFVSRHQISDEEKQKFPSLAQKAKRYYVRVATTEMSADRPPSAQDKQTAFLAPQKLPFSGNGGGNGSTGAGDKKRKRT